MSTATSVRQEFLRRTIGTRLKKARELAEMTQKEVADRLGVEYFTFVSQMENGRIAPPPSMWRKLADILGLDQAEFITHCLYNLYPEVYGALYGKKARVGVMEQVRESLKAE